MNIDFAPQDMRRSTIPESSHNCTCPTPQKPDLLKIALRNIKGKVFSMSRSFRIFMTDMVIAEGKERRTGNRLKILYVGETQIPPLQFGKYYSRAEADEIHSDYLFVMSQLFSEYELVQRNNNIFVIQAIRKIKQLERSVDMVFVNLELLHLMFLDRHRYLSMPKWVNLKLDIARPWDAIRSTFRKNFQSEIKKHLKRDFSYCVSSSRAHFEYFYHRMYLPYTQKRFGGNAFIYKPDEIFAFQQNGEIIFLFEDNKLVTGTLLACKNGQMFGICSVAAEGLMPKSTHGAFAASYYFSILRAFERGCHLMDFLGSRPILEDGAFQFKRKWGSEIKSVPRLVSHIHFRACRFNESVIRFLEQNPMILNHNKAMTGRILLSQPATIRDIERVVKRYDTPGLKQLDIFCLSGADRDTCRDDKDHQIPAVIHDLSLESSPQEIFFRS